MMATSLFTIQKDLRQTEDELKEEAEKKVSDSAFDHKASSLIQSANKPAQAKKAPSKVKVLTAAGKKKQSELKAIDPQLCKDDQEKAKEDIEEKYKNQALVTEHEVTAGEKRLANILGASEADEEQIKAQIAALDNSHGSATADALPNV